MQKRCFQRGGAFFVFPTGRPERKIPQSGRRPHGRKKKAAKAACICWEGITFSFGKNLFWKRICSTQGPR